MKEIILLLTYYVQTILETDILFFLIALTLERAFYYYSYYEEVEITHVRNMPSDKANI